MGVEVVTQRPIDGYVNATELCQRAGTWVHPKVAIHLGRWISPAFAVQVTEWVFDWMTGRIVATASMPVHVQRFLKNRGKIPHTHFSMLNEIYLNGISR